MKIDVDLYQVQIQNRISEIRELITNTNTNLIIHGDVGTGIFYVTCEAVKPLCNVTIAPLDLITDHDSFPMNDINVIDVNHVSDLKEYKNEILLSGERYILVINNQRLEEYPLNKVFTDDELNKFTQIELVNKLCIHG